MPASNNTCNTDSMLDCVAVPVIGFDCNLRIVAANREAREAFGEFDQGPDHVSAISTKPSFRTLLQTTLETKAQATTKVSIKEGFGIEYSVTLRAVSPARDDQAIALVLTFEDRSSLRDVKSMRSDFVANVSHEIRSPLTAISGFAETLQGPARDDPEAREVFLNLMGKEVRRLTNLVSDLLSLSKVEVKERRAPRKIIDANQVIAQAMESVGPYVEKHGKILINRASGALPNVPGNHGDLVRLLINLLENAVNYSRDGSEVTLSAKLAGDDNPLDVAAIRISVQDWGEGIAPEEIPRLTERFYRVDKSRSRNVGGTGLGLAIVKHVLVRHRGKIEISSVPGEGSEFRVYLPVAKPEES